MGCFSETSHSLRISKLTDSNLFANGQFFTFRQNHMQMPSLYSAEIFSVLMILGRLNERANLPKQIPDVSIPSSFLLFFSLRNVRCNPQYIVFTVIFEIAFRKPGAATSSSKALSVSMMLTAGTV